MSRDELIKEANALLDKIESALDSWVLQLSGDNDDP